ncbi:MAG: Omp28-related outer membrane protein [Saprospiraceae bacterium]
MKSILLTIGLMVFAISTNGQAIEIPKSQVPLITKISASWCPHCGNWGWNFYEGLREDNVGKAIMVTAHYSGDYRTDAGAAIASNFGIIGQPEFYIGTDRVAANSNNYASMVPSVNSIVNAQLGTAPVVQSGIKARLQPNGMMTVNTSTQFFSTTTGEYYLAMYLLENNFVGYQAGQGNAAAHKNILRAVIGGENFGDLIGLGEIAANTKVDLEHDFNLGSSSFQVGNVEIVAVIWEKIGNKYKYVNANSTTVIDLVSANEEIDNRVAQFTISPNPVFETAVISFQLSEKLSNAELRLFTLDGKQVQVLQANTSFAAGQHRIEIQRSNLKSAGVYLVQLISDQGAISRKLVVQ